MPPAYVLSASIYTCFDYEPSARENQIREIPDSIKRRVSAVLVPISVKNGKDNSVLIAWACSRGRSCKNSECVYACKGGHE